MTRHTREDQPMPRIPYPTLTPEQTAEYEQFPINANLVAYHLPQNLFSVYRNLGTEILFGGNYDAKLRELIILRVGFLSECAYEIFQHRALSKRLGVDDAKVEAVLQPRLADCLSDKEAAVLGFVDETLRLVRPSDACLAAVQQHLDASEIAETILIIAHYMGLARILEVYGVEIDEDRSTVKPPGES